MSNLKDPKSIKYCAVSAQNSRSVTTSNKLVQPIDLSINEYKALLYAMAVANYGEKKHQPFMITEETYIYLNKIELGEMLGLSNSNSIYVAVERLYKELSSRMAYFIIDDNSESKTHSLVPVIRELRWEDNHKNVLQIRFTSEVIPYFSNLTEGNFTTFQLKELFALSSISSINLYTHIQKKCYLFKGMEEFYLDFSMDELKRIIDLNSKYKRWVDFRRYHLDIVISEIRDKTLLNISYVPLKKSRSVVGVRIIVKQNSCDQKNKKSTIVYLDVPFSDNPKVKELGARFDVELRCWYIQKDDEAYDELSKWLVKDGCLTKSQATTIMADPIFQMDFAESGEEMEQFKRRVGLKLTNDPSFVKKIGSRINEILGKKVISL